MTAQVIDMERMWHSDHYRMSQHTDLLAGPIWDALTDLPGMTSDELVDVLAGDLRVRTGMSFYLSFGEEQGERAGAKLEDVYREWPVGGTPEEKFRFALAERTRYRLDNMRKHGYARRIRSESGGTGWEAGRPPLVWEPIPEHCPKCGRKPTSRGRRRPWKYREGSGPSVHTRTVNLIDDISDSLAKNSIRNPRPLLEEAARLLTHYRDADIGS